MFVWVSCDRAPCWFHPVTLADGTSLPGMLLISWLKGTWWTTDRHAFITSAQTWHIPLPLTLHWPEQVLGHKPVCGLSQGRAVHTGKQSCLSAGSLCWQRGNSCWGGQAETAPDKRLLPKELNSVLQLGHESLEELSLKPPRSMKSALCWTSHVIPTYLWRHPSLRTCELPSERPRIQKTGSLRSFVYAEP